MKQMRQTSETFLVASILALVGGFCDTYSYLCRDEVFANAQTGNIVLLAVNIANFNWIKAAYYLLPISAFVIGVFLTEIFRSLFQNCNAIHWRQVVVIIEMGIILVIGLIPYGKYNFVANVLVSFFCAIQLETFRKVQGNVFASTMCTGNLRSASAFFYKFLTKKDLVAREKCKKYLWIDVIFLLGAMGGTVCSRHLGVRCIWILEFLLLLVFLLMFVEIREESKNNLAVK